MYGSLLRVALGFLVMLTCFVFMRRSRGGQGVRTPMKIYKTFGFLSNTGPNPLKNHKATNTSQHSILGHHRHASDEPPLTKLSASAHGF